MSDAAAERLRLWTEGEGSDRTVDDDIAALLSERESDKRRIAELERVAAAAQDPVIRKLVTQRHEDLTDALDMEARDPDGDTVALGRHIKALIAFEAALAALVEEETTGNEPQGN